MSEIDTYTASAAATYLGVSPTMVYRWLSDGTLEEDFSVSGAGRYATAASVKALKAAREGQGEGQEPETDDKEAA